MKHLLRELLFEKSLYSYYEILLSAKIYSFYEFSKYLY